jgi:hypothetical protein
MSRRLATRCLATEATREAYHRSSYWTYRFPARVSRELLLRRERQPKPIREIAWKAKLRLCARDRKLARTGKPANVITAAVARELAAVRRMRPRKSGSQMTHR